MIKTTGKRFERAMHFDFHTCPGIDNIFGNFDAERFAKQLEDAKVGYVNLTARCNMGFSYYDTAVGKKYPGLGERDPFAEMLEACHRHGIGVTAYINVGLDHELAADDPGLLRVDGEGRIYRENKKDSFFRTMCYNTRYRAHLLEEIKEICAYDIDGLFCDCIVLRECFCPACMSGMAKRGVDISDRDAVLRYQEDVRRGLVGDILDAMGEKRGRIKAFFNGMPKSEKCHTHSEIECLTSDRHWGFDYFDQMAAYTRTLYEDRVYMSGRFQNSWGDFGGIKPLASMQNDMYDAVMNSFGISFGDHLHPVDGFEPKVAERIGMVMREKLAYEPYTRGSDNIVEIGVIIHTDGKTSKLPSFLRGAVRMLKEFKLTYNVYDENAQLDACRIKLLIIGENAGFDADFKARLRGYIKDGGKVIFAGTAADLGMETGVLGYISGIEKDENDNAYFLTDDGFRAAVYAPSRKLKNAEGKEIAKYVANVRNYVWDGRHSYEYRPQGGPTEYSAAVTDGNTACVCFDIFNAYADNFLLDHRDLMKKLIDGLLREKLIESPEMPVTATVALTENAEHTVLHVKATYPEHKAGRGIIEEHILMKSVRVSVLGGYKNVYVLPEKTRIDSKTENGRTVFKTGDVLGYRAFLLEK